MSQVPFANGRAADLFDLGDGTVLRRYRTARDSASEARLMQWLFEAGYPVPRVHRSNGPDLVMDRIDGPTMLEDLGVIRGACGPTLANSQHSNATSPTCSLPTGCDLRRVCPMVPRCCTSTCTPPT